MPDTPPAASPTASRPGVNMCLAEWIVEITLQGPFLTASSAAGPWGLDAVCARDALGRLYIAGSQIRGKLREALDDICQARGESGDMFGKSRQRDREQDQKRQIPPAPATDTGEDLDVHAGRYPLLVSDFIYTGAARPPGVSVISRVKIDGDTGAAAAGQLRTIDAPFAAGEEATFRGTLRFACPDAAESAARMQQLLQAFHWIAGWGAEQTTGMGRTVSVREAGWRDLRYVSYQPPRMTEHDAFGDSATFDWKLADAFCTPSGVVKGNIYESDTTLRGDILKGAVAQGLRDFHGLREGEALEQVQDHSSPFAELCAQFSDLRFLDARPSSAATVSRPGVAPHSLAVVDDKLWDLALWEPPDDDNFDFAAAPRFLHDWKPADEALVAQHFPQPTLQRELRVRTAIDSQRRRAVDSQLFAYRMIRPEGACWQNRICWQGGDSQLHQQVWQQLSDFLAMGWIHLGKSKARAQARLVAWNDPPQEFDQCIHPEYWSQPGTFVVTLASQALLIDPLASGGVHPLPPTAWDETGDGETDPYHKIWHELSGGTLTLVRRFVTHRWIGGHLARRFPRRTTEAERYYPILLTEPGNVFVLRAAEGFADSAAGATVRGWHREGLPLPQWAQDTYGSTFDKNPFLPSNGYGEILVNQRVHQELRYVRRGR